MKLSTRLVLLILGCLLPVLTAQVYSQFNLYAERHKQFSGLVLHQARLAGSDMASVVDAARQMGAAVAQAPEFRAGGQGCADGLTAMRDSMARYGFLALVSGTDGHILCVSAGAPDSLTAGRENWVRDLARAGTVTAGPLIRRQDSNAFDLPLVVPAGTGQQPQSLIAGLKSEWLDAHAATPRPDDSVSTPEYSLVITDRDGIVVNHPPGSDAIAGRPLPGWLKPMVGKAAASVDTLHDAAGNSVVAAYVPALPDAGAIGVIETLRLPSFMSDINQAATENLLITLAAAIAAVFLARLAGRRFIYQPTDALLQAARKWREGDLSARATQPDTGSEFAALSQSFNAMAAGLQAREMERRLQSSFLEAQVAERTRELSDTNNRLQVEIAGREKTEAALHQAQKLQAVGQLAGGIAHDFNNMLATVLGNLELMERRVPQPGKPWTEADSEKLQRLIERATGAVLRGSQLTSRLLAFSRRQRLAARPTDINALLTELITLASSTLGRRVKVIPELAETIWSAMVDPSQVEAAILNLCLNARDAMPEGGELRITTANVSVRPGDAGSRGDTALRPGDYVRVSITDTGTGMSKEVQERAFDPFFTTKGPNAGSGLGLSQVYGMARQSGGDVKIDSTIKQGTTITLWLPRAVTVEDKCPAAPETKVKLPSPGTLAELVLIVDDDQAVRQVTVEMARDLGCEVVQASGGEQALAMMDRLPQPPRLILLDYAMPGMNGLQLAQKLRDRGATAPIALVTGYAELSDSDVATSELAGLLRKPFTIRELQGLLVQMRAAAAVSGSTRLEAGLVGS